MMYLQSTFNLLINSWY